jgi:Spy/CpxP family protein refolding chaperone
MFSKKIAIALTALATITLPAFAQDATKSDAPSFKKRAGHHRGGKGFNPLSKLTGTFALTPDQQQKVASIKAETKSQIQSKRDQLKTTRLQLRDALSASTIDTAKAQSLHDELQSQQAAIQKIRFNSMLSVTSILTPEQRAQLKAQMSTRFQRGGASKPASDKG